VSTPRTVLGRALLSRHFIIAAAVLLVASVGSKKALKELHLVLAKKAVPLLAPLDELPESFGARFALATEMDYPTENISRGKFEMTEDVEETLGTKHHLTWFYKDKQRSAGKTLTYVRLHIAYYPQMLDPVPHVPDVCMSAAGYDPDPDDPSRQVLWSADNLSPEWQEWRQAPIQRSTFVKKDARTVVFHVFSVNGEPVLDRVQVSAKLSDPRKKYCYYAKAELSAGCATRALTPDEYDEICQAFWSVAAGEILKHFPSAGQLKKLESAG
jgi:hypothetical protein